MKNKKSIVALSLIVSLLTASIFGGVFGFSGAIIAMQYFPSVFKHLPAAFQNIQNQTLKVVSEESAITEAVEKVNPAVVSIIVTKDLPIIERYYDYYNPFGDDFFSPFRFRIPKEREKGTEKKEVGGGTGFLVSSEGILITNKHVVSDEEADYTVLMNDGTKYDAKVLARDPSTDLAFLKIEKNNLPFAELGDSTSLKLGQGVIAIGNSLGEFRNTVSTGVVSGLSRSITASGGFGTEAERLEGVVQTDAAINPGNSGGPLINLDGQVIGVNTAIVQGAQNVGFAIPINTAKRDLEDINEHGRIRRPFLGVRYIIINEAIKDKNQLSVDYGALITPGEEVGELAVMPGSPADKAGLEANDIILEMNEEKVDLENSLAKLILKYNVGDEITLRILHKGEEKILKITLAELE